MVEVPGRPVEVADTVGAGDTVTAALLVGLGDAGALGALAGAEQLLGGALGRLFAVAEAYPDLKADQTMRELSEELSSTENRIGFARQAYNDHVLEFNDAAAQFPTLIIARLFGFQPLTMLASTTSEAERETLRIQM